MTATATPASLRATRWRLRMRNARQFARRFMSRRDGVAGAIILLVFAVLAIAPTFFVGPLQTVTTATGPPLAPPSPGYPLGTDEVGRSMLNLTVHGARVSMVIGLLATAITILLGAVIGIFSGYVGGRSWSCRRSCSRSCSPRSSSTSWAPTPSTSASGPRSS
jgi:peptide/nickel transport system permease protein